MKFSLALVVVSALGLLCVQNVAGQDCDFDANATFAVYLDTISCILNATSGLQLSSEALDGLEYINDTSDIADFTQTHDPERFCDAVEFTNESLLYFFEVADQDNETELAAAVYDCYYTVYLNSSNATCNTTDIDGLQSTISCISVLANGDYNLSDAVNRSISKILALNASVYDASVASNCSCVTNYTNQILDEIANLTYVATEGEDGNTTVADVLNSCLAPNETCNATDLEEVLRLVEPIAQCVLDLAENYYFGNESEYEAVDLLYYYIESAFEAVDKGNCSALNESLYGIGSSFDLASNAIENDPTANESGLAQAFIDCFFPNGTCNITYLNLSLLYGQEGLACYLALADGTLELPDDLAALLSELKSLNETAFNESSAGDCDALNATLKQMGDVLGNASALISNGSNSDISDAVNTCLFPNTTCSDENATLNSTQAALSCIIALNSSFTLNDTLWTIINSLVDLNLTAFNASNSSDCDTLNNTTALIVELAQNFTDIVNNSTDTDLACALNSCLYGNVTCNETCSIASWNDTLNNGEPIYDCLCDIDNEYDVSEYGSYLLDEADKAYVEACLAVEGDNCTAVGEDVQLFIDTIQEFINYTINSNESSVELVNAVSACANLSSTTA